jgi:hypothetical protein
MILAILGTLALIATVVVPGAFLMKTVMDKLVPRLGFIPAAVACSLLGGVCQLGLGLILVHLSNFLW